MVKFSFILLFLLSSVIHAESDELNLSDMALVRLGGQVYFLRDIENLQVSFKALQCLEDNSFIEKYLSISTEPLVIKNLSPDSRFAGLPEQLKAFILIEKLKLSSISSANIFISNEELYRLSRKCAKIDWDKLGSVEKSLFVSEVYLRQRFATSKDLSKSLKEFVKSLNVQHSHELLHIKASKVSMKALNKKIGPDKDNLSLEKQDN